MLHRCCKWLPVIRKWLPVIRKWLPVIRKWLPVIRKWLPVICKWPGNVGDLESFWWGLLCDFKEDFQLTQGEGSAQTTSKHTAN
jgi:hypothetical protein